MEMLAIVNLTMKDALEQTKAIYALAGSPKFFKDEVSENKASVYQKDGNSNRTI